MADIGKIRIDWIVASGAPTGGTGEDSDYYIDSDNGNYYKKTAGTWSLLGTFTGTPGSVWYSSAGVPSSGTGVDGDNNLDTNTGDIYKKISGTWTVQMTLNARKSTVDANAPTVHDDTTLGYSVFSTWLETGTSPTTLYIATDVTATAAVWRKIPHPTQTALGGATVTGTNSIGSGTAVSVSGDDAAGIGRNLSVTSNRGIALGQYLTNTHRNATLIGVGASGASPLASTANDQIMFAVGSANPDVLIDANGVKIGYTASPPTTQLLHIGPGTTTKAAIRMAVGVFTTGGEANTLQYDGKRLRFTDNNSYQKNILTGATGGNYAESVLGSTITGTETDLNTLIILAADGGALQYDLHATPNDGDVIKLVSSPASAYAATIDGNGKNINGGTTHVLTAAWNSVTLQYVAAASTWTILSST